MTKKMVTIYDHQITHISGGVSDIIIHGVDADGKPVDMWVNRDRLIDLAKLIIGCGGHPGHAMWHMHSPEVPFPDSCCAGHDDYGVNRGDLGDDYKAIRWIAEIITELSTSLNTFIQSAQSRHWFDRHAEFQADYGAWSRDPQAWRQRREQDAARRILAESGKES